jgi:hypothetical protein
MGTSRSRVSKISNQKNLRALLGPKSQIIFFSFTNNLFTFAGGLKKTGVWRHVVLWPLTTCGGLFENLIRKKLVRILKRTFLPLIRPQLSNKENSIGILDPVEEHNTVLVHIL